MMALGFILNLVAAFGMLRAYRKGSLATDGLYSIFVHPMYALQILITIPGLLLIFNSWLVLLTIIPAYIAYKIFAREEERYLEAYFGSQYINYKNKVLIRFI
jgi:protein-S-isoprenylcysteine O-methyltransferase Ste14